MSTPDGHPVLDLPFAPDHHPVGLVGATQEYERSERIAGTGKTAARRAYKSARSACLPTAIAPMSSRPRQRADPSVAQRNTSKWVTAPEP